MKSLEEIKKENKEADVKQTKELRTVSCTLTSTNETLTITYDNQKAKITNTVLRQIVLFNEKINRERKTNRDFEANDKILFWILGEY